MYNALISCILAIVSYNGELIQSSTLLTGLP